MGAAETLRACLHVNTQCSLHNDVDARVRRVALAEQDRVRRKLDSLRRLQARGIAHGAYQRLSDSTGATAAQAQQNASRCCGKLLRPDGEESDVLFPLHLEQLLRLLKLQAREEPERAPGGGKVFPLRRESPPEGPHAATQSLACQPARSAMTRRQVRFVDYTERRWRWDWISCWCGAHFVDAKKFGVVPFAAHSPEGDMRCSIRVASSAPSGICVSRWFSAKYEGSGPQGPTPETACAGPSTPETSTVDVDGVLSCDLLSWPPPVSDVRVSDSASAAYLHRSTSVQ